MNSKKSFFHTIIIFIIAFLLFFTGFKIIYVDNKEITLAESTELTLKESIVLGLDAAKKWNENALFHKLTSSDENRGGTRGDSGKRYDWNLFFVVPGTDKQLLVGISKGKIDLEREVIGSYDALPIKFDDIKFDSPHLLKIVKDKYNLQQGEDWATGYHYTLDIIDDKPTVTVVGIDKDKLFTKVNIDPKNGEITGAIHKVPEGGELFSISSEKSTPRTIKKNMEIKGISGNGNSLVAWGDSVSNPFIELSNNNGETWNALNVSKSIVHAWFNSNNELYVATESEVLRTKNTKNKMESILTLKTPIEGIDYSTSKIAIWSNKYIYVTDENGYKWNKFSEPEPVLSLQISEDGSVIVFSNNRKVLLKNGEKWENLKLLTNETKPSDLKVINNDLYLIIDNELWVYNLKNERLNKFKTETQISQFIKKGENLFGISEEGAIYLIDYGDESIKLTTNRLFSMVDKIVADVEITHKGLFVATKQDYSWQEIN